MRIHNVHERVVTADADALGPLLARLGQPDDVLYPPGWRPMRFDGPVALGARGTHGTVCAYEPGRHLELAIRRRGITGTHGFTLTPSGDDRTRLRHSVEADATLPACLLWHLVVAPSHDAVLEGILDRAEAATGTGPSTPATPSVRARMVRFARRPRARATTVPASPLLARALPRVDYRDAFAIERRRVLPDDPRAWADAAFHDLPAWVGSLLGLRAMLVGLVGIERGGPELFDVVASDDHEVLLGGNANHLDFRAAVRCEPDRVVLSTVVMTHNRRGRAYFGLVRRVHPLVVRAMLNRAAARVARRASVASTSAA